MKRIQKNNIYFLCIAVVLVGCSRWHRSKYLLIPHNRLHSICRQTLQKYGYQVALSKNSNFIETKWKFFLYPLNPNGYRQKVYIQLWKPAKKTLKKPSYQIRLKVVREKNISTHDHMDQRHAVWICDGYNLEMEKILLKAIKTKIYLETDKLVDNITGKNN